MGLGSSVSSGVGFDLGGAGLNVGILTNSGGLGSLFGGVGLNVGTLTNSGSGVGVLVCLTYSSNSFVAVFFVSVHCVFDIMLAIRSSAFSWLPFVYSCLARIMSVCCVMFL